MNILLSVDTAQPWILQTIINHEGHEGHEEKHYKIKHINRSFVIFVFFVVIFRFMRRLYNEIVKN